MRVLTGGVAHLAKAIENDLSQRETHLHIPHIKALADLTASVLTCRNINTSEWKTVLPRETGDEKSKERYISRVLSNRLIEPMQVIRGYLSDIVNTLSSNNQTIVLMLDQSKIAADFECLMVSMHFAGRALPVAFKVVKTAGEIGFDIQEPLLHTVLNMLPKGVKVLLSADRFYGTAALIQFCQKANWKYRIRLRSNLILHDKEGGEIKTGEAALMGAYELLDVRFNNSQVSTNIGILHEEGHSEPWIIAMDCLPSKYTVLDYGMRWGIECLFSDFKSRGFGITKTNLKHEDRIERLILIITIAVYWAVSTGMAPNNDTVKYSEKNLIAL